MLNWTSIQRSNFGFQKKTEDPLINAINKFATEFFLKSTTELKNENFAFSPLSIHHIFSMLLSGAKDQTQKELMDALGYGNQFSEVKEVNNAYRLLLNDYDKHKLKEIRKEIKLIFESMAVCDHKMNLKNDFENNLRTNYNAEVKKIKLATPEASKEINDFVSKNTDGLIPKIIDKLDPLDVLVLINVFYFKGEWIDEFQKGPKNFSFKNADGTTSLIEIMSLKRKLNYAEDEFGQYCELPYKGNLTMRIFLPKDNSSTDSMIKNYRSRIRYRSILFPFERTVNLLLPKFKIENSIDLKNSMAQMGVEKLFTKAANLNGISEDWIYASQAVHKAYIDVNEKGTTACAVSFVNLANLSALPRLVIMIVNRPFFFDIYDEKNGLNLFSGIMNKF